jgi:RimJ/RimL family protein N-acetyltransferase
VGKDRDARLAPAPPLEGERVRLRDGTDVLIRPVRPEDRPLFVAGFERLSEESRHQRFLAYKRRLTERELAYFTEVDHEDHEAIGALHPGTGEGLGVARYVRLEPGGEQAEAAVVVADAWQGRGLGTALLRRLAERAAAAGVRTFCASVLTENRRMLRLVERLGEVRRRADDGQVVQLDVALDVYSWAPLEDFLRAAARAPLALQPWLPAAG